MTYSYRKRKKNKGRCCMRRDGCLVRAVAVILVIILMLLLVAWVCMPPTECEWKEYAILPGDTLWTIARCEFGDSIDIRYVIDAVIRENAINPDALVPGEVILIPVEGE